MSPINNLDEKSDIQNPIPFLLRFVEKVEFSQNSENTEFGDPKTYLSETSAGVSDYASD